MTEVVYTKKREKGSNLWKTFLKMILNKFAESMLAGLWQENEVIMLSQEVPFRVCMGVLSTFVGGFVLFFFHHSFFQLQLMYNIVLDPGD